MKIILGILIPLFGTTMGSSFVFFLKNNLNNKIHNLMIGFAIGVMLSSSLFSLIIPSISLSNNSIIPASIGIILGIILMIIIGNIASKLDSYNMLFFSVTLHNIPEGMAVGVSLAGSMLGSVSFTSALMLSIGIAIQNIPEGSIISIPYKVKGNTKFKSFVYGFLSGIVEPISSVLTLIMLNNVIFVLPYLLCLAAGSMIYVVFNELLCEIDSKSKIGYLGIVIGFILMMLLDILFG